LLPQCTATHSPSGVVPLNSALGLPDLNLAGLPRREKRPSPCAIAAAWPQAEQPADEQQEQQEEGLVGWGWSGQGLVGRGGGLTKGCCIVRARRPLRVRCELICAGEQDPY